jgi:hypothetical protein
MGKTEPKNKIICWHEQERCDDSNMDSDVRICISTHSIPEVSVSAHQKHATTIAVTATEFV